MWMFVLKCFYFMMPAYFANMAPVIAKRWFKKLAFPVDFNYKIKGKPLFGKNKTFRGFFFGILFAIIIALVQRVLYYSYESFRNLSFIDYSNWLLLGFLIGFGAIFGDLIESFFKRRLDRGPGTRFFPWDQLDFVIGALVFSSFVVDITFLKIVVIILLSVIGHILVNHSAYYLGIRKEKW